MIEDIIDSKIGSLVLGFFLVSSERSFSIFEVSKKLKLPNLKVARVLNKLVAGKILKSFSKKGKKYFILNLKYYLLPDLKKAFKKIKAKHTDELFIAIKGLGQLKAAFLSGIFTGYANLPVDILLVGRINLKKLDCFLKLAKGVMGQEINYSIMRPEEFVQRRETFDKFIKDIFDYNYLEVIDKLPKKKQL